MIDYHIHSHHSGDIPPGKGSSVDELCSAAVDKGIREIAITDHYDIDGIYYGAFREPDFNQIYKEVSIARDRYADKIRILFGIEIGQAVHMSKEASRLISRFPFDFVIGSVHAVRGLVDIFYLDLKTITEKEFLSLLTKYMTEMNELITWGEFDTLAHITYIFRYLKLAEREELFDLQKNGPELFSPIFERLIQAGKALEVNTSGLWQGLGYTLPGENLIKLYREMGGSKLTIGSDAHHAKDIGKGIEQTFANLKNIGFDYVLKYKKRVPDFHYF